MSNLAVYLRKMDEIVQDSWEDAGRCDKGSRAAGARLRKRMSQVKQLTKDIRGETLHIRDVQDYGS